MSIPDCGGHVGETFIGHIRPGQTVREWGNPPLPVLGGERPDRTWTAEDERANPTHAVCPTCADLGCYHDASALRAHAAQLLADGFDPRDVLGAFDEFVLRPSEERTIARLDTLVECCRIARKHREQTDAQLAERPRCYHGRRAIPGNCAWCAIVAARSDA